jgi:hypothetical protein
MIPISGVVDAALVSSASDPPLSSDSILIKWRPVTAAGIGSWDNGGGNHTIIMTPGGGGVLVSWLVSLLSEEIKGFIVQGLSLSSLSFLSVSPPPSFLLSSFTMSSSDPVSSTSRIHFIQYSSPPSSDPGTGISVSISPNHTILSSRAIREYVRGVSDQRLYILNSGSLRG